MAEAKIVRHKVLYIQDAPPNGDFRPLASRDVADPNAGEDFQSMKLEEITRARQAGAPRPAFKIETEEGGKPVREKA